MGSAEPLAPSPPGVGQRSPDGYWQWDGARWVPTSPTAAGAVPQATSASVELWGRPHPLTSAAPPRPPSAWRYAGILCAGAAVILVLVGLVDAVTSNRAATPQAGNRNCAPAPCGDDGRGFRVVVDSLDRDAPTAGAWLPPAAGDHLVRVTVHFSNDAEVDVRANPLDFQLLDSRGVRHGPTVDSGPNCAIFASVHPARGATVGPRTICFDAGGDPSAPLTLVWREWLHDVDIDLAGARTTTSG